MYYTLITTYFHTHPSSKFLFLNINEKLFYFVKHENEIQIVKNCTVYSRL